MTDDTTRDKLEGVGIMTDGTTRDKLEGFGISGFIVLMYVCTVIITYNVSLISENTITMTTILKNNDKYLNFC